MHIVLSTMPYVAVHCREREKEGISAETQPNVVLMALPECSLEDHAAAAACKL